MTKKHFIKAAEIVKTINNKNERRFVATKFAELFYEFNPRFNRDTFWKACELE